MQASMSELSINLWSDPVPAHDQLLAQIHALAPDARIGSAFAQNQLCVVLAEADASTVAALEALLQNDFGEAVFSYRWYAVVPVQRQHQTA